MSTSRGDAMARASATYQWDEDCAVSVSAEANWPDSVAEVTVNCRRLLREAACDLADEVAHADEEQG